MNKQCSKKYHFIYKTTNLINGKIYVGQKSSDYLCESYLGSGRHLKCSINKYGVENFQREIIEFCNSVDHLNEREIYWIEKLDARNPEVGYNIAKGGNIIQLKGELNPMYGKYGELNPFYGKHHTEENRKRMGRPGVKASLETRQKLSLARKGRVSSMKGKTHSEETKKKMSLARVGKPLTSSQTHQELLKCPHCSKVGKSFAMKHWHFDNCLENPDNNKEELILQRKLNHPKYNKIGYNAGKKLPKRPVVQCPHCNIICSDVNAKNYHFDNCKLSPLFNEEKAQKRKLSEEAKQKLRNIQRDPEYRRRLSIAIKNGKKPEKFICPICDRQIGGSHNFKQHIKKHKPTIA